MHGATIRFIATRLLHLTNNRGRFNVSLQEINKKLVFWSDITIDIFYDSYVRGLFKKYPDWPQYMK